MGRRLAVLVTRALRIGRTSGYAGPRVEVAIGKALTGSLSTVTSVLAIRAHTNLSLETCFIASAAVSGIRRGVDTGSTTEKPAVFTGWWIYVAVTISVAVAITVNVTIAVDVTITVNVAIAVTSLNAAGRP
jgi:hypothetical protein